ncbi:MAG: hypothetical protein ACK5JD_04280 [Mangrovibacterium sp.]
MLNLAVLSGNKFGHECSALIGKFRDVRLTGVSAGHNELTGIMLQSQAEKIMGSSQAVYFDQFPHRFDLFRTAIRNRNHLFCNSLPDFSQDELKQLLKLSHEAGSIVQILAPVLFYKNNLKLMESLQTPFLADFKLALTQEPHLEQRLTELLMLLVLADKSELRKIDLMAIPANETYKMIEIRLAFVSGSVARFLFSQHLKEIEQLVTIIPDNAPPFRIHLPPAGTEAFRTSEEQAFGHFLKSLPGKNMPGIGLPQLLQIGQIRQAIRSRLNVQGRLPDQRKYVV